MALTPNRQQALDRLDSTLMPISRLKDMKTIVLLGADPSQREPVMELRIRQALNKHDVRLAIVSSEDVTLSTRAHARLKYPREQFEQYVRALASSLASARGYSTSAGRDAGTANVAIDRAAVDAFVHGTFAEGPVAVLYDDSFVGVQDAGAALEAVASFVDVIGEGAEVGTIPLLDDCNSMGARDLGLLPAISGGVRWGPPLTAEFSRFASPIKAAFVLGSNLAADLEDSASLEGLENLDLLVVTELTMTDTAKLADVILPAASFAEKTGTFTNTERRVQRLTETVPSPGIARADWEIFVDLSQYFDNPLGFSRSEEIWDDIRRSVDAYADITYIDMGLSGARPESATLQPV
jgi:predicted molibdopterin-dependent oxidoreductase YjgC